MIFSELCEECITELDGMEGYLCSSCSADFYSEHGVKDLVLVYLDIQNKVNRNYFFLTPDASNNYETNIVALDRKNICRFTGEENNDNVFQVIVNNEEAFVIIRRYDKRELNCFEKTKESIDINQVKKQLLAKMMK